MGDMVYVSIQPFDLAIYVCLTLSVNRSSQLSKTRGNIRWTFCTIYSQSCVRNFIYSQGVGSL
jgi:hypothetical protein